VEEKIWWMIKIRRILKMFRQSQALI